MGKKVVKKRSDFIEDLLGLLIDWSTRIFVFLSIVGYYVHSEPTTPVGIVSAVILGSILGPILFLLLTISVTGLEEFLIEPLIGVLPENRYTSVRQEERFEFVILLLYATTIVILVLYFLRTVYRILNKS